MTKKQLNQIENIAKKAMKNSQESLHGLSHVLRVKQNALKIIKILNLKEKVDVNLLQAICLLHDLTYTKHRLSLKTFLFEGVLVKNLVSEILEPLDISKTEKKLMLQAISNHPHSFPFRKLNKKSDLYTKILQDADTLDYFNKLRIQRVKNKNFLFKTLSLLINFYIAYGKRNIRKYLNFPELANFFFTKQTANNKVFQYKQWGTTLNKVILCIHGYSDNASMFKPLAKIIKDRYRIIALTLPMSYEKGKIYSISDLADYIESFRRKIKLKRFTVVGFSLGGSIATQYCLKYPDKVKKLYLLNSPPQLMINKNAHKVYKYIKPLLMNRPFLFIFSYIDTKNLIRKFAKRFSLTTNTINMMRINYISIFGTVFKNLDFSITEGFNKLQISKTAVFFKDDEMFKWKHFKNYAQNLRCDLRIFDTGGHTSTDTYWKNIAKLWQ